MWTTCQNNFFSKKSYRGRSRGGLKIFFGQFWLFWKSRFELWWPNTSSYKKFYKTKNLHFIIIFHKCGLRFDLGCFIQLLEPKNWFFAFLPIWRFLVIHAFFIIFYHALVGMHACTRFFLALKMTWLYVIHHSKDESWAYGLWLAPIGQLTLLGGFRPAPSMELKRRPR